MFLELLSGLAALTMPVPPAQGQDCRAVPTNVNGRMVQKTMCRGPDGQWRELVSSAANNSGPLAANFRGSVTYKGDYEGVAQRRARPNSRTSLNSLLTSALDGGEKYGGTSTIVLEFDGNLVTGTIDAFDGRRNNHAKLSGTRQGNQCSLFDADGAAYEGICDAGVFRGNARSAANARIGWKSTFATAAVATVDFVERDRQAALERAEAAAKAKAERDAVLAERAKMKRMLPRGAAARYLPIIEAAVLADSQHWALNRYQAGSADLVAAKLDSESGAMFTKSYFLYSDGREGWVGVAIKGNKPLCLVFWDDPQGCRAIGEGYGGKMMQGAVNAMLTPPSWMSSGGSGYGSDADYQRYEENCRAEGKTPGNC